MKQFRIVKRKYGTHPYVIQGRRYIIFWGDTGFEYKTLKTAESKFRAMTDMAEKGLR